MILITSEPKHRRHRHHRITDISQDQKKFRVHIQARDTGRHKKARRQMNKQKNARETEASKQIGRETLRDVRYFFSLLSYFGDSFLLFFFLLFFLFLLSSSFHLDLQLCRSVMRIVIGSRSPINELEPEWRRRFCKYAVRESPQKQSSSRSSHGVCIVLFAGSYPPHYSQSISSSWRYVRSKYRVIIKKERRVSSCRGRIDYGWRRGRVVPSSVILFFFFTCTWSLLGFFSFLIVTTGTPQTPGFLLTWNYPPWFCSPSTMDIKWISYGVFSHHKHFHYFLTKEKENQTHYVHHRQGLANSRVTSR